MEAAPLAASWNRTYDHVVSLGCHCQPAYQIRRALGIETAQVFDWIITTDQGLVALIRTQLEGFFARERLTTGPHGYVIDGPTDTRFIHEFTKDAGVDATYEQQRDRLMFLADRWRTLMDSDARVLFVRQHAWDAARRESAVRLRDAIGAAAPRLSFSLLYLTRTQADDEPWHEPGIINHHLTQPEPYDWRGDDVAWERCLRDALAFRPVVGGHQTGS